jgi:hypothetical protein
MIDPALISIFGAIPIGVIAVGLYLLLLCR